MKKSFYLLSFGVIVFMSCSSSKKLKEHRALLKEYAFCSCFAHASDDSTYFSDKDISASVYADISEYNFNVFPLLDSIAKKYALNIKPSEIADHENKKAIMLNCFMFYHSKQLDSLVKTMDKDFVNIKGW